METYKEESDDSSYYHGGLIEMDAIGKNTRSLISAICRSKAYREYKEWERQLMQNPELMARVDQFRAENFLLQNESGENLFQDTERLVKESAELRRNREVNAYLDAELALCKLIQKVCLDITEGMNLHIPEI